MKDNNNSNNNTNNSNNTSKNGKKFLTGVILLSAGILLGVSISIFLTSLNNVRNNYSKNVEVNVPYSETHCGEPIDLPPHNVHNNENTYISLEKAKQIALNTVINGSIISYEQDLYDDVPKYTFKILKDNLIYKVKINALDESVIKIKIDD